ncbi:DUF3253 domain-containing protein [Roseovarius sp. Pro17]|uniref:DUF3253 domain-containing protein n=1 Tax=Roseovarius sp. Pro17 TaxID=3108175 RepID=UPI002D77906B|nr:DUF3253 domain-containing protein [Roseovarius sp. Pro17]
MNQGDLIADAILTLATERGPDKTICPSEVARHIAGQDQDKWRPLMPPIRAQALKLAEDGKVEIRKGGETVDLQTFSGIYRITIRAG